MKRSFAMIRQTLLALLLFPATLQAVPVFIGTGAGAKGIYQADFDSATGRLAEPVLAAEYNNPGFLALHPTKPVLYACGAPAQPFADGTSAVAAFAVGADHGLKLLGEASSGGKGACHVAVDKTGGTVAVANYGDGVITTIRLDDRGVPVETASAITNHGSGPNKQRQAGPHAHGVYFNVTNNLLLVPDLGLDKVFVYPFDPKTSKLGAAGAPIICAPGSGPRHMAVSPDWQDIYILGELNGTVMAVNNGKDHFNSLGSISTLPENFSGSNTTAEIEVHPNGKFVYASNRGHDSIVVYLRDPETGALKLLQHAPCGGKVPRHFKIDPSGKWLLCGHQESNTISVLPLDPATGRLGEPVTTVKSPSPICLLFVP